MSLKPSKEVFITPELDNYLKKLKPNHKFRKWIYDNMKTTLRQHIWSVNLVRKKLIPKYYKRKYDVENSLYVYDHPEGYRSCYTIIGSKELYIKMGLKDLGTCPLILDLMPHPEYERRFGY